MAEKAKSGLFHAAYTFTPEVLQDFEDMYLKKKEIAPGTRILLGLLGLVGALYFGWSLYRDGFRLTSVGYVIICGILLLVALSGGSKRRPDNTLQKYQAAYKDKKATFSVDEEGLEFHLNGQRNYARSKFKEVYGLFDTDLCYYVLIKGRAYYIIPKASIAEDKSEEFAAYLQKKCGKHFLHYDLVPQ